MSRALAHHRISASLAGQKLGHHVVYLAETASTNDEARALALAGYPEGVVVFADAQTAGRGRRGAEWFAPPQKSLLFSLLLRPQAAPELWPLLTHTAALAVSEAIELLFPELRPQIKWPNDIFLNGRKAAGLLLESGFPTAAAPYAVLGLGLNVNVSERDLPPDLRGATTSLATELGTSVDRESVAIAIVRALNAHYPAVWTSFPAQLSGVRRRSLLLGRTVRAVIGSQEIRGVAVDHSESGELVVESADQQRTVLRAVDSIRLVD